jgi:hypothetical protein
LADGLYRILFFPLAGELLLNEKIRQMLHYFFVWIVGCPNNPSAEEVGGIEVYLYEARQNFELFSKI